MSQMFEGSFVELKRHVNICIYIIGALNDNAIYSEWTGTRSSTLPSTTTTIKNHRHGID